MLLVNRGIDDVKEVQMTEVTSRTITRNVSRSVDGMMTAMLRFDLYCRSRAKRRALFVEPLRSLNVSVVALNRSHSFSVCVFFLGGFINFVLTHFVTVVCY